MLACKHVVYGMQIAITDEEIVKALVAELVQVMSGAPFAAALKVRATAEGSAVLATVYISVACHIPEDWCAC